eukprot:EG_transcript_32383
MPQTQTQTRTTMKSGATGSCVTTFRKNGDIYAIAHTLKPTGYKAQHDGTRFDGTTTYKANYCSAFATTGKAAKPLVPYHQNALRNQLPIHFEAATMLKKGEDPITGVNRDPMTRFVTTNQRTYTSHQGPPVGYSNQGIVAEQTKWIHKRQAD